MMKATISAGRSWRRKVMQFFGALIVLLVTAGWIAQRTSDGPAGPFPGGRLRAGELVTESDIDWRFAIGQEIELQLVDPMGSRTTGVMVHEGELYVACDLGFLWGRFSGQRRWILNTIYLFKGWHEDAMRDGRVVLRIAGKRYERQAIRVTYPELLRRLRTQVERDVRAWISPEPLAPAPTEGPDDIWFFRMDPRHDERESLAASINPQRASR